MYSEMISVIIPVYKTEKYLNRCVESIVNQTYKNTEIILVDDGSPDNCPAICDEWAKKDSRIKVLHMENKGAANARNTALEIISGDYAAFADSDDYLEPDMLEKLYDNLRDTGADISVCSFQINSEEKSGDCEAEELAKDEAVKLLVQGDYMLGVLWNKLYKTELVKGVKMPLFVCCEDLVFNYYVFKSAEKIVITDAKLYHYNRNENSTTKGKFNIGAFDAVKSKEIILEDLRGSELEPYAVKGLINSAFVVLSGVISSGVCLDKYDELRKIIRDNLKTILKSSLYSPMEKIKAVILSVSKTLYNKIIRSK